MSNDSRRQFLEAASVDAGVTLADAVPADEKSQEASAMKATVPAFAATHQPNALSFDPAKLNGLPEKLVGSHWENNFGGSVGAQGKTP